MSNEDQPVQVPFSPWYKEPWAWYILLILIVALCWVSIQVYTAFSIEDSVVVDDYYKSGKAINQDLSREKQALLAELAANITFNDHTGEVHTTVSGHIDKWPKKLMLRLLSPAFASDDQVIPSLLYSPQQQNQYHQEVPNLLIPLKTQLT